jgi:tRNA (uracil-5-)-methyltransferase
MDSNQEQDVPLWFTGETKEIGQPCPLKEIIECDPEYRVGYRNKVEFTIGRRQYLKDGGENEICVGFTMGNLAKGIQSVDRPDDIKVIPKGSLEAAKIMENLVKESELEPYDKITLKGFWRLLLYRESKSTNEVLISVITSKTQPFVNIEHVKERLAQVFPIGKEFSNGKSLVTLSLI